MTKKITVRIQDSASVLEGAAALIAFSKNIREGVDKTNKKILTVSSSDMLRAADMLDAAATMIDTLVSVVENNEPIYGVFEPEY